MTFTKKTNKQKSLEDIFLKAILHILEQMEHLTLLKEMGLSNPAFYPVGSLCSWDGHRGKIVGKQTGKLAFFLTELHYHS